MIKKSTGIYISSNKAYLAQMGKVLNKPKLIAAGSVDLPEPFNLSTMAVTHDVQTKKKPIAGGQKANAQDEQNKISESARLTPIESAIRALFKKEGLRQKEIIATVLPADKVVIRYFQMARLAPQEQRAAIPFEARKYLPYKLEDIAYAYDVSFDKVPSNKMAVTFVAAEKASVSKISRLFNNAGARIGNLETISFSLKRLLYHTHQIESTNTMALAYIDQDHAIILLVRNKVLYLTRNVSFGSKMTFAASETSAQEIQRIKIDTFMSEVRLSLDYFHRQFPEEKIEKLFLWTDDDNFKSQAGRIGEELNINTSARNPLVEITSGEDLSMEYSIACGLALKKLFEPTKDINLSLGIKKIEVEKLIKTALSQACIAIVVLILVHFFGLRSIGKLEKDLQAVKAQFPKTEMPLIDPSLSVIQAQNEKYRQKADTLRGLIDGRMRVTKKISRISELMPQDAWLASFELVPAGKRGNARLILKGKLYTSGKGDYINIMNKFVDDLKKDPQFTSGVEKITLDSISKKNIGAKTAVSDFKITCSLR